MSDDGQAFGRPGATPTWQTARKTGVGTACSDRSRVWFTLARGIVTEVYYPRVDVANTRDLQFLITDGASFVHEEQRDLLQETAPLGDGIPAYQVVTTDPLGRYRLRKRVVTDPHRDALVLQVRYDPLRSGAAAYRLYLLLHPQVKNSGWHNHARIANADGRKALLAWRKDVALALVTTAPVPRASCGFVGASDGWQDLHADLRMDWEFERADDGNVALMAEVDLDASSRAAFTVVLGFGTTVDEALATARTTLAHPYPEIEDAYVAGWRAYLDRLTLNPVAAHSGDGGRLARMSAAVLAVHEDKSHPGAHIASLSIPWGEYVTAVETGGYHFVWPRDLYHIVTARLVVGDAAAARRALEHLMGAQQPDGAWPQNAWVDGAPHWHGLQLDEVAFPVLLAWHLRAAGALDGVDPWPMVRLAATFIARNGPVTPQERWEENAGYSPSTLALEVAALVCASQFAADAGEAGLASYYLDVADAWASRIEDWAFTRCGALLPGSPEHYERIASLRPEDVDRGGTECRVFLPLRNRPPGTEVSQCCLVDPSFLDLVRYGVRAAHDPHVVKTVPVVDALLRVETPCGPVWHRYNGDGYGEREDGAPYDGVGIGRAWPLLTGERGHYELAAGRDALPFLRALECFASGTGLLPEQVWDAPDLPERQLTLGRGTGAATPLVWAHAEYLKLLHSASVGRVVDRIEPVYDRYARHGMRSDLVIWKFNHQVRALRADRRLRIEVYAPAVLHWSADAWTTVHHDPMEELVPGVWIRDFPARRFSPGRALRFTFYWPEAGRWEGRNFLTCVV